MAVRAWRKDDPELDAMIAAARMRTISRKIERIDEAGERGDVKADQWYVERAKETREHFGPGSVKERSDIVVQINVNRAPPETGEPIIDITPEDAEITYGRTDGMTM